MEKIYKATKGKHYDLVFKEDMKSETGQIVTVCLGCAPSSLFSFTFYSLHHKMKYKEQQLKQKEIFIHSSSD